MQNKTNQGQKVVSPVFNSIAKYAIFVLNMQGWRLKTPTAHLHQDLPWGASRWELQHLVAVSNASGFFFFSTSLLLQCDYSNRGHPDKKWDKFWN